MDVADAQKAKYFAANVTVTSLAISAILVAKAAQGCSVVTWVGSAMRATMIWTSCLHGSMKSEERVVR